MESSHEPKRYDQERKKLADIMANETTEDVLQWYDDNATVYEEGFDTGTHGYTGAVLASLMEYVGDKTAAILDLGAGSGQLGQLLTRNGYTNIDAVDGSASMLRIAREKSIYKSLILAMVGTDPIQNIREDYYNCIVAAAVFASGTLQYMSIPLLMKYLKKGGFLIFSVEEWSKERCAELRDEHLRDLSHRWEEHGLCRSIESSAAVHYRDEKCSIEVLQKIGNE